MKFENMCNARKNRGGAKNDFFPFFILLLIKEEKFSRFFREWK